MSYLAPTSPLHHASVDKFVLMRDHVLFGERLRDVQAIQRSVSRFGLLSPIVAMEHAGALMIVDGRKRLAALRRMAFAGTLPRSLVHVPYRLIENLEAGAASVPTILRNAELYDVVKTRFIEGESQTDIAKDLFVSRDCIRHILSLRHLAPQIRQAFFGRLINFDQARAFAALPDHNDQLDCYAQLGPFAKTKDILDGPKPAGDKSERRFSQTIAA